MSFYEMEYEWEFESYDENGWRVNICIWWIGSERVGSWLNQWWWIDELLEMEYERVMEVMNWFPQCSCDDEFI